jgi:thymidylate kinase
MKDADLAPVIAIVGSDGSGKSTVGGALLAWLAESRPVAMCHLGKQTGDYARKLARMPFLGRGAAKALGKRSEAARGTRRLDAISALGEYLISMRRVRRFRRMLAIRRSGVTVIADRYPQTSVPSSRLDGPHLATTAPMGAFARMLARRERAYYDWMASYRPDLVVRLNVDLATAVARKPDHGVSSLATKVEAVPRLTFNGAPIVDIDSTLPLAEVLARAKQAVADALAAADRKRAAADF